jgi:hypothetical protein
MSCSVPRVLSYYTNKVNIYDNKCYIPLPNWRACPAPPCIILSPHLVYPPCGPCEPPNVCPIPQPLNPAGTLCGPCNIVGNSGCATCQ